MAAAAIIARLLQAGTRQGQKAAAALLRMLKKSNPATLEKNVYKEYGNLGRRALSKDILGARSATPRSMKDDFYRKIDNDRLRQFFVPRGMQEGVPMEKARAIARLKKAASHGFPKGVKNTPGGMRATKKGFEYRDATPNLGEITMRAPRRGLKELRSLERTAERSYNFPRKDFKPTSFKQFKRGTKRKNARKLAELRRYVDFLSRGGAG